MSESIQRIFGPFDRTVNGHSEASPSSSSDVLQDREKEFTAKINRIESYTHTFSGRDNYAGVIEDHLLSIWHPPQNGFPYTDAHMSQRILVEILEQYGIDAGDATGSLYHLRDGDSEEECQIITTHRSDKNPNLRFRNVKQVLLRRDDNNSIITPQYEDWYVTGVQQFGSTTVGHRLKELQGILRL